MLVNKLFLISYVRISQKVKGVLEHVYMKPEVYSNRFEISDRFEMPFRLHGNLHRDSLRHLSKQ